MERSSIKMNSKLGRSLLTLLVAGLLTACTTASIQDTWRSPEAPATVYRKLLIVGVANDVNVRQTFENIFVETLRKQGVDAVPSHTLIPDIKKADRALLQEVALQAGTDAVVITRGLSKAERTNYQYGTGQLQQRTVVMQESGPDSSTTVVMSAVGIAPRETYFELVTMQTRFFDTASATLLWSALSNVTETGRRADAFWKLSALLVEAMQKDKVIEGR